MLHNLYSVCESMPVGGDTLRGFIAFRSTDSPAAPLLPSLVSLPAGKVVHCCREIASGSWLLLHLRRVHSHISASSLSICLQEADHQHTIKHYNPIPIPTSANSFLEQKWWSKSLPDSDSLSFFLSLTPTLPFSLLIC